MKRFGTGLVAGSALGAGLMYILDPRSGNRRRALMRDKAVHATKVVKQHAVIDAKDLANRAKGRVAEMAAQVRDRKGVDDDLLRERVLAHLGHHTTHPRALDFTCLDGVVTLTGPILADEADELVCKLKKVRGVKSIDDRMTRHAEAGNLPSLQGGNPRRKRALSSPGIRLLAELLGTGLVAAGGALLAKSVKRGRALREVAPEEGEIRDVEVEIITLAEVPPVLGAEPGGRPPSA